MATRKRGKKKEERIVGVCGKCGRGVFMSEGIYRICSGCGQETIMCECKSVG